MINLSKPLDGDCVFTSTFLTLAGGGPSLHHLIIFLFLLSFSLVKKGFHFLECFPFCFRNPFPGKEYDKEDER